MPDYRSIEEREEDRRQNDNLRRNEQREQTDYRKAFQKADAELAEVRQCLTAIEERLSQTPTLTQFEESMRKFDEASLWLKENHKTLEDYFHVIQAQAKSLVGENQTTTPTEEKISQLVNILKGLDN